RVLFCNSSLPGWFPIGIQNIHIPHSTTISRINSSPVLNIEFIKRSSFLPSFSSGNERFLSQFGDLVLNYIKVEHSRPGEIICNNVSGSNHKFPPVVLKTSYVC